MSDSIQGVPDYSLVVASDIGRVFKMGAVDLPVLKNVSLSVAVGESVAVTGLSGAGKTTLLHILGGLDKPTTGSVVFKGQNLYRLGENERAKIRAREIGFVFQAYHLLPELDILENVMLPYMTGMGTVTGGWNIRSRAMQLLDAVGLAERAKHRPSELSGGEQQRAAIARSLMNDPELVFADEPTGNLDTATGEQVLRYLFSLTKDRGRTLVLVTHNEQLAAACSRRINLVDGTIEVMDDSPRRMT